MMLVSVCSVPNTIGKTLSGWSRTECRRRGRAKCHRRRWARWVHGVPNGGKPVGIRLSAWPADVSRLQKDVEPARNQGLLALPIKRSRIGATDTHML